MRESLDSTDVTNYPPRKFTRTQKNGKVVDDTFFCSALCGHFKNCPYIHEYLERRDAENHNEEDDLF